jgi:hypothetical protein
MHALSRSRRKLESEDPGLWGWLDGRPARGAAAVAQASSAAVCSSGMRPAPPAERKTGGGSAMVEVEPQLRSRSQEL